MFTFSYKSTLHKLAFPIYQELGSTNDFAAPLHILTVGEAHSLENLIEEMVKKTHWFDSLVWLLCELIFSPIMENVFFLSSIFLSLFWGCYLAIQKSLPCSYDNV